MIPVFGPFLFIGIVAWVAAIVMGVGSWFGLTSWRRRWPVAGALAGLGTFELYLHAHSGYLPVLVFDAALAFPVTAALFVGGGVGAAFGTVFLSDPPHRPALEPGSAEEALWLADAVDGQRVGPRDWLLTGALLLPAAGLLSLGVWLVPSVELAAVGLFAALGPLAAGVGLALRSRRARGYELELEALRRPEEVAVPEGSVPPPGVVVARDVPLPAEAGASGEVAAPLRG